MARVFAQNVQEIAVISTYSGRPHVNVWHMWNAEGTNTSDADTAQDFANNWQDHMMLRLSNELKLVRFEWRSLDPDDTNVGTIAPDTTKPMAGASAANGIAPNVALLIHKRTSNRPRGARDGRMFLAGALEDAVNNAGVISAALKTAMDADLQAFLDGISDDPAASDVERYPVVLETTQASRAPGTQEVIVNSRRITGLDLDPLAATQRDRLR